MNRWYRAGLFLLAVSLLLNLYAVYRVHRLSSDFQNLQSQTQNSISNGMSSIRAAVSNIGTREAESRRWATRATVEPGKIEGNNITARLSWQIKDYPEGSPVYLYYRKQGETEYASVKATSTGGGNFFTDLEVEKRMEPEWVVDRREIRVGSGYADKKPSQVSQAVVESVGGPGLTYRYYITMKDGKVNRTTEEETFSLAMLSKMAYNPLQLYISSSPDQVYKLDLHESGPSPGVKLAGAFLEVYRGDEKTGEKKFVADPRATNGLSLFRTEWDTKGQVFDSLRVRAEYDNGEAFTRQIHPSAD